MKNITKNKKTLYRKNCEDCNIEMLLTNQQERYYRLNKKNPVCKACKKIRRFCMVNCEHCNVEFQTERKEPRKYCSRLCFKKETQIPLELLKVRCLTCSTDLTLTVGQRYTMIRKKMQPECYNCKKQRRKLVRERIITCTCARCGEEFTKKRTSKQRYCSGMHGTRCVKDPTYWTRVKCATCDKEFDRLKNHVVDRNYCSTVCHNTRQRLDSIIVTCARCGKDFSRNKYEVARSKRKFDHIYCSRDCCYPNRHTINRLVCVGCGKGFTTVGHKRRKYCSVECRPKAMIHACRQCGTPSGSRKREFCTETCREIYLGVYQIHCVWCNKIMKTYSRSPKTYCNRKCMNEYNMSRRLLREAIISAECHVCKKEFKRTNAQLRRIQNDNSGLSICSMSCGRIHYGNKIREADVMGLKIVNGQIKGNVTNHRTRKSGKILENTMTYEKLIGIYQKQNGLCALTGITMTTRRKKRTLTTLSPDRIDSSVGYVDGNVQLVCVAANYMKNDFTQTESMDFIKNIRQNGKG